MTSLSKMILGCLLALAASSAVYAQDISPVAKVSAGTAAITAAVVLLHGDSDAPSASSTGSVTPYTGSDIGRGSDTSSATFAGFGNNTSSANNGASTTNGAANGPLAPGGAAGLSNASKSSTDGGVLTVGSSDSGIFAFVEGNGAISILTGTLATLATGSVSTYSTGTSP